MSRMRKVLLLSSLAMLVLFLGFGCSLLLRDAGGVPASDGWYIKLQIKAPAASKGITVTEYQVTGLQIEVRDPEDEVLQTINWEAEDGSKSYLVPVNQLGQYEIEVTHIGEQSGQTVEATESAVFNIQAMVITVIDIVPGCIGLIKVEPGGQEQEPWFIGLWVDNRMWVPWSPVVEICTNGKIYSYDLYSCKDEAEEFGTWVQNGDVLTLTVQGSTMDASKQSENEFVVPNDHHLYRKGWEPEGSIFSHGATELQASEEWTEGGLLSGKKLYSFAPGVAGSYEISWEQEPSAESFVVSAYHEDGETPYFPHSWEVGYDSPQTVTLVDASELVYIIVDADGVIYRIRVE